MLPSILLHYVLRIIIKIKSFYVKWKHLKLVPSSTDRPRAPEHRTLTVACGEAVVGSISWCEIPCDSPEHFPAQKGISQPRDRCLSAPSAATFEDCNVKPRRVPQLTWAQLLLIDHFQIANSLAGICKLNVIALELAVYRGALF